jgi:hypothetical protein
MRSAPSDLRHPLQRHRILLEAGKIADARWLGRGFHAAAGATVHARVDEVAADDPLPHLLGLLRFTDDDIAPEGATNALLDRLGPHVLHRRLAPSDIGAERIGHFGFFRPEHRQTLWEPALAFIDAQLARRAPTSIPPALEWPTARGGAELASDDVPN